MRISQTILNCHRSSTRSSQRLLITTPHNTVLQSPQEIHSSTDARVNVLGLLNVLTNCTRANVRKIIFASSGASYGTPAHLPLDEESSQLPESPYGITKMVAEHYLRYWQETHGLNYTALRYGNV